MAKIEYTETEHYLIGLSSNLLNLPIYKLETLASMIDEAQTYPLVGFYVESSRSQVTDNTVYELLIRTSYDSSLHGDWIWVDAYGIYLEKINLINLETEGN